MPPIVTSAEIDRPAEEVFRLRHRRHRARLRQLLISSPAVRRPSRCGSYLTVGRALRTTVPDLAAWPQESGEGSPRRAVLAPHRPGAAGRREFQTVMASFPCARPPSRWRMASGTSGSRYVLPTTGVT